MNAASNPDAFDKRFEKPGRPMLPGNLRRRMNRHPMVLFVTVVVSAFLAMALHPAGRTALVSPQRAMTSEVMVAEASQKAPRLHLAADQVDVCDGQNWGAEDEACLQEIARQSGRDEVRKVRMIASAATGPATAPNIF
ncbi:MAG: hypothetical protein JNL61_16885 [Rhizobiaceae bacterium]|nr:hypothetical protein [Rhizobiaceae bacterium]